jgi:two-component system NarL family response regulator
MQETPKSTTQGNGEAQDAATLSPAALNTPSPASAPPQVFVLVIDDHPIIPEALQDLIGSHFDGVQAIQAPNLRQARTLYQVEKNIVVTVLDLRLPDADGMASITDLRALRPEIPLIVFTGLDSDQVRRNATEYGATAVVCKTESTARLLGELSALLPGHVASAKGAAGNGPVEAINRSASRSELSPRQQQIWQGIAEGMPNIEIAQRLNISLNTTKAHVRELLQRLGVRNRTEAATLYFRRRGDRQP